MKTPWPETPLGDILTERRESPNEEAVLFGRQPIIKKIRFADGGMEFRASGESKTNLISIHPGDLVLSGINAAKGAIALYEPADRSKAAATIHYSSYSMDRDRVEPCFLWLLLRHGVFRERLERFVPNGIKTELKASKFLPIPIPLPPLPEQRRTVAKIDQIAARVLEAKRLAGQIEEEQTALLLRRVEELSKDAPRAPMAEVAPVVRRPVQIQPDKWYPELGIRSFGKGTFHKDSIIGSEVGSKRLFRIEPGDLLLSNVFSWEGAIAVVKSADKGRFGSHRFITCVPNPKRATAQFLCYWFLSDEGLADIRAASPGAAGRNKTLGIKKLEAIEVPLPPIEQQHGFGKLIKAVQRARTTRQQTATSLQALMPALLDQAFRGDL